MPRGGLKEALDILFLGPREVKALLGVPALIRVESLFWAYYLLRFLPLDIYLQGKPLSDRPFLDFRFGETPYFTGLEICRLARLAPGEKFFDLGCGRGKMVFTAAVGFGAEATGVDLINTYIRFGSRISQRLGLSATFVLEDFTLVEVFEADVVYGAGSIFEPDTWTALLELVEQLQPGSRWVCVGREADHPLLERYEAREFLFSWGYEMVYFYEVSDIEPLEHLHAPVGEEFEQTRAPAHLIADQAADPENQIEVVLEDKPGNPTSGVDRAKDLPIVQRAADTHSPPDPESQSALPVPTSEQADQVDPQSSLGDDVGEMSSGP